MTFGFPLAFWFAMLALPVAAAFFYRRRAQERVIPALEVWEALGTPVNTKSISSLLRRLLSLLMQLLLLILLVLALADPSPAKKCAGRTVIVLDVSATLQTHEGAADRMSIARREAMRALNSVSADGEAVVLRAARSPVLAQGITKVLGDARTAIETTEPLDIDGDLPRAVEAARAFVDPEISCEVVVISDFAGVDAAAMKQTWHDAAQLELVKVGAPRPDAAITGFWAEQRGAERHVVARIVQSGMSGKSIPVHLNIEGQRVETKFVQLTAGPVQVEFTQPMPSGATYEIAMDSGDDLAVDDHAIGIVPKRELRSICLVTAGDAPLERALIADPSVRLRVVAPEAYHGPEGDSVIIVDGPGLTVREPGNASYLFIGAADPFGWAKVIDTVPTVPITHWAGDHPALADIDPTLFHVSKVLKIQWRQGITATELVSADNLSLATDVSPPAEKTEAAPMHHLYWLFDLHDSDLPRRLSFPLLLWNAIDYLASGGQEAPPDSRLTGRLLHVTTSTDQPPIVTDPAGQPLMSKPAADGWVISNTHRQGVYKVSETGEAFAFNLLSDRGIRAMPADDSPFRDPSASIAQVLTGSFWSKIRSKLTWRSLLALTAALAAVEWFLFNRRVIRIG